MALSVTAKNYTLIDACIDATTWNGESPLNVDDFYKEGTRCTGFTIRDNTGVSIYKDAYGVGQDWSNEHIRFWFMTTSLKEIDKVEVYITDSSANTNYYVFMDVTDDTKAYPGGWWNVVVDLEAPTSDSGTPADTTDVITFGLRFTTNDSAKNSQNTWIDHVHLADGLIAYGDNGAGGAIDLNDVYDYDDDPATGGWGILTVYGGVYYTTGSLTFGDSSGTDILDFDETGQILIFQNRPVAATLYGISVVGNATGNVSFVMGEEATGNQGIKGCTITVEGTQNYTVDMTDTDIDTLGIYGCTFNNSSTIDLPVSASGREVFGCSFISCGIVDIDTCAFENNSIIEPDTIGIYIDTASHGAKNLTFIMSGSASGVEMETDTETNFDKFVFSGTSGTGPYDVYHSTSGALIINNLNLGNAEFASEGAGGSTTFKTSRFITITVQDANTDPIENSQVGVYKTSDRTELVNKDSDGLGEAEEGYNGANTDIEIRVRKASTGETKYVPFSTLGYVGSGNYELLVTLQQDPNA